MIAPLPNCFSMAPIAAKMAFSFSETLLTSPPEWPRTARPGELLAARHPARDGWSAPAEAGAPRPADRGSGTAPPRARALTRRWDGPRDRPPYERASAPGRAPARTDQDAPSHS